MTLEQKIEKAAEFGKAAFERGAMAVAAHDPELLSLLKDLGQNFNGAVQILDAWNKAFHKANAEASWE